MACLPYATKFPDVPAGTTIAQRCTFPPLRPKYLRETSNNLICLSCHARVRETSRPIPRPNGSCVMAYPQWPAKMSIIFTPIDICVHFLKFFVHFCVNFLFISFNFFSIFSSIFFPNFFSFFSIFVHFSFIFVFIFVFICVHFVFIFLMWYLPTVYATRWTLDGSGSHMVMVLARSHI